jgi:hypothetical protein
MSSLSTVKKIEIHEDEHVFIVGGTGSGKSALAEKFLSNYSYVIKLDTKDEVSERRKKGKEVWSGLVENKDYTICTSLYDFENVDTPKIIYVPNVEEQNEEHYDLLCKYVYERGNTILWIDELMSICASSQKYPLYLKALVTRGRSKNSVVWALSQRPYEIPSIITSMCTHFFMFHTNNSRDRKAVADMTEHDEFLDNPPVKYSFFYNRIGEQEVLYGRIKI